MDKSLYRASQLSDGVTLSSNETDSLLVGQAVVTDVNAKGATISKTRTGIFAYESNQWWFLTAKGVVDDFRPSKIQILKPEDERLQALWDSHGFPHALLNRSTGSRFKCTIEKLISLMFIDCKPGFFYKLHVITSDSFIDDSCEADSYKEDAYLHWDSIKEKWDLYLVKHRGDAYPGVFVPTSVPRIVELDGDIRHELPLYFKSQVLYPNLFEISEYPDIHIKIDDYPENSLLVGDAFVKKDGIQRTGIFAYEINRWWFFTAVGVVDVFKPIKEHVQTLSKYDERLQGLLNSPGLQQALFYYSEGCRYNDTIEKLRSLMLSTTMNTDGMLSTAMNKKRFYRGKVITGWYNQDSYNVSRGYYKWNIEKGDWDLYLVEHSGDAYGGDFVPMSVPEKVESDDTTLHEELPVYFEVLRENILGLQQQLAKVERMAIIGASSELVKAVKQAVEEWGSIYGD